MYFKYLKINKEKKSLKFKYCSVVKNTLIGI